MTIPNVYNTTKTQRRALMNLERKRDRDGRTPCQEEPWRWDANRELTADQRVKIARQAAVECLGCHAYWQCDEYAVAAPEIEGVIAGQLRAIFNNKKPRELESATGTTAATAAEHEGEGS